MQPICGGVINLVNFLRESDDYTDAFSATYTDAFSATHSDAFGATLLGCFFSN
jgi:hypothetical protein